MWHNIAKSCKTGVLVMAVCVSIDALANSCPLCAEYFMCFVFDAHSSHVYKTRPSALRLFAELLYVDGGDMKRSEEVETAERAYPAMGTTAMCSRSGVVLQTPQALTVVQPFPTQTTCLYSQYLRTWSFKNFGNTRVSQCAWRNGLLASTLLTFTSYYRIIVVSTAPMWMFLQENTLNLEFLFSLLMRFL